MQNTDTLSSSGFMVRQVAMFFFMVTEHEFEATFLTVCGVSSQSR